MITTLIIGIIAIIFGIIILIWPKLLNIVIAIWLIIWGLLQILDYYKILVIIETAFGG